MLDAHNRATGWFGGASPAVLLAFGVVVVVVAAGPPVTTFLAVAALLVMFTAGGVIRTSSRTRRSRRRGFAAVATGFLAMLIIGWSGIGLAGFGESWSGGSLFTAVCVFSAVFGFTWRT